MGSHPFCTLPLPGLDVHQLPQPPATPCMPTALSQQGLTASAGHAHSLGLCRCSSVRRRRRGAPLPTCTNWCSTPAMCYLGCESLTVSVAVNVKQTSVRALTLHGEACNNHAVVPDASSSADGAIKLGSMQLRLTFVARLDNQAVTWRTCTGTCCAQSARATYGAMKELQRRC